MRKSQFSEEQSIGTLRLAEAGQTAAAVSTASVRAPTTAGRHNTVGWRSASCDDYGNERKKIVASSRSSRI